MYLGYHLEYLETQKFAVFSGRCILRRQGRADQSGGYAAEMESTMQGGRKHASRRGRGGAGTKSERKSKNWLAASKLGNAGDDDDPSDFFINLWHIASKLGGAGDGPSDFINFWCSATV